jgi:Leucine-rich repeat (LRR) protein
MRALLTIYKEPNITETQLELPPRQDLITMFNKLIYLVFLIPLTTACSFNPYAISVNDNVVYSPSGNIIEEVVRDPGLQGCINAYLNNNAEATLETISQLSCTDAGITSLIGLNNIPNLSLLDVSNNRITDLSPVIYLENLRILRIANNSLRDISTLSSLNLLNFIDLSGNELISCRQLDQLEARLGSSLRRPLSCNQ